jgi:hypothetical protein
MTEGDHRRVGEIPTFATNLEHAGNEAMTAPFD